ncbi:MAG: hypothetical protein ACK5CE_02345 [Actinomycetes bacterium]
MELADHSNAKVRARRIRELWTLLRGDTDHVNDHDYINMWNELEELEALTKSRAVATASGKKREPSSSQREETPRPMPRSTSAELVLQERSRRKAAEEDLRRLSDEVLAMRRERERTLRVNEELARQRRDLEAQLAKTGTPRELTELRQRLAAAEKANEEFTRQRRTLDTQEPGSSPELSELRERLAATDKVNEEIRRDEDVRHQRLVAANQVLTQQVQRLQSRLAETERYSGARVSQAQQHVEAATLEAARVLEENAALRSAVSALQVELGNQTAALELGNQELEKANTLLRSREQHVFDLGKALTIRDAEARHLDEELRRIREDEEGLNRRLSASEQQLLESRQTVASLENELHLLRMHRVQLETDLARCHADSEASRRNEQLTSEAVQATLSKRALRISAGCDGGE